MEDWLDRDSHGDPTIRAGIQAKFAHKVRLLQEYGTLIGTDHVRRLSGYDNLWEIRIKEGTIHHRFFFGLGAHGVIAVACVVPKASPRLGVSALRMAESRVAEFLAELDRSERRD